MRFSRQEDLAKIFRRGPVWNIFQNKFNFGLSKTGFSLESTRRDLILANSSNAEFVHARANDSKMASSTGSL